LSSSRVHEAALREQSEKKRQERAELAARIRRAHEADPDVPLSWLATRFGCWPSAVRDALTQPRKARGT